MSASILFYRVYFFHILIGPIENARENQSKTGFLVLLMLEKIKVKSEKHAQLEDLTLHLFYSKETLVIGGDKIVGVVVLACLCVYKEQKNVKF